MPRHAVPPRRSALPNTGILNLTCTRRQAIVGAALAVGSSVLFAASRPTLAAPVAGSGPADSVGPTSIHQEIRLGAPPARIFELLVDATQFSAFTGRAANVTSEAGRAFSLFGGMITGRNVELVPGERVVQAWRSNSWPVGTYSIVRFALNPQPPGTLVVLDHTGYPVGAGEHLAEGWYEHYWRPLQKLLG